jgi:inhibitor of cysteine peptidase
MFQEGEMFRTIRLIVISITLLMACAACGRSTQGITITEQQAGKTVELKNGDDFVVTLEGNPTTGYTWEMAPTENAIVQVVGEPGFQQDNNLLGSPGKITLHFKAIQAGEQTLTLIYHRPWEKDTPPLQTFELTVVVK